MLKKLKQKECQKLKLLLASGKPSADDQNKASHDSGHRDSQARHSERRDTDETGMDSHNREEQQKVDAKCLEDLKVEKFFLRRTSRSSTTDGCHD